MYLENTWGKKCKQIHLLTDSTHERPRLWVKVETSAERYSFLTGKSPFTAWIGNVVELISGGGWEAETKASWDERPQGRAGSKVMEVCVSETGVLSERTEQRGMETLRFQVLTSKGWFKVTLMALEVMPSMPQEVWVIKDTTRLASY